MGWFRQKDGSLAPRADDDNAGLEDVEFKPKEFQEEWTLFQKARLKLSLTMLIHQHSSRQFINPLVVKIWFVGKNN